MPTPFKQLDDFAPMKRRQERPPVRLRDLVKYRRVKGDEYQELLWNKQDFTEEEKLEEMLKCKESVIYFLENYCIVRHPDDGLVPFIPYGYQKNMVLPAMMHVKQFVTRKFRQGGFTTIAALYVLWILIFETDKDILVISKTDREAMNVLKMIYTCFDCLPDFMRPRYITRNAHVFQLETGSRIQCYTPSAGASFSASILLIDEAAKIDKMDERWADIYPVISAGEGCKCWVISTCNGVVGKGEWYYRCWIEAVAGKNGFLPVDVPHQMHPLYSKPEWLKKQRASLGEHRFRQEVLREFISAGNCVFKDESVTRIEEQTAKIKPLRVLPCPLLPKGSPHKNMRIYEEPKQGMEYIVSVDVAEGLGSNDPAGMKKDEADYSTIQVLRLDNLAQVAEYQNDAVTPMDLAKVVRALGTMYNEGTVVCEASAIGQSMTNHLLHVLQYDNIYSSNPSRKLGLIISHTNRTMIYTGAIHILEKGLAKLRSVSTATELRTLVFNQKTKRIDHLKGYHDDLFTAIAYGYYVREQVVANLPPGADLDYKPIYSYNEQETEAMAKRLMGEIENVVQIDDDALLPSEGESHVTHSAALAAESKRGREVAVLGVTTSSSNSDDLDDWGTG